MHIPTRFQERDLNVLHELIRAHPLGTWITTIDGAIDVHHIPFFLSHVEGKFGVLRGHVNVANPIWNSLENAQNSTVVFQGAETYISPSWYASKQEHEKVVPTWNYAVVHAQGTPKAVRDAEWLLAHLNELTDSQEAQRPEPWQVSDAPEQYINTMLRGIVGIEIPITDLIGAWKTSQNKNALDKAGVIEGLKDNGDSDALEVAAYIKQHS